MKKRKILSLFLSFCLILGLLPTAVLAADQTDDGAGIRIVQGDAYDSSTGIFSIKVQAKVPTGAGIKSLGVVLTYDNTKLTLVNRNNKEDLAGTEGTKQSPKAAAINILLKSEDEYGSETSYSISDGELFRSGSRCGLYTFLYTTDTPQSVQTSGNWFDCYEVLFRVAEKPDDPANILNSDSLRIADSSKDDAVIKGVFPSNNIYSIYLTDNSNPAKLYVLNRMSECPDTEVAGEKSLMTAPGTGTATYPGSTNSPSPATTPTPTATFTATGPDSGTLSGLVSGGNYAVTGAATANFTASGTTHDLNSVSAGVLSIVKKGNGTTTTDSTAQTITVTKAATPSTVTAVDCTAAGNDGKLQNVTAAMEYQKSGDSAWTPGTGSDIIDLPDGTYLVRVKANGTELASDNQTVTINAYSSLPSEGTPTATFTATGPDSGTLSGLVSGGNYAVTGAATANFTASGTTHDLNSVSAGVLSIVKKGNGTTTTDSTAQTITVTKAATPSTVTAVDCTAAGNDGKLQNVTAAMEYQKSGDSAWTPGTGSDIIGLSDGTYLVRVKATGTVLASNNQSVVIAAYVAPVEYTISFDGNGGTPSASHMTTVGKKLSSLPTATHSGSYSFDGWYTAISGGIKITTAHVFSGNTTVYAHWTYTGGGGGGGGSYTPSYSITVDKTENGTITVSPKSASKGDTVTVTAKPDKGYELDTLKVLDKNGDKVKLTEKNGKYTFTMPTGKVTVKGSFVEEAPEQIFADVPVDAYYYEAVKWAAEKGITGGVGNDLFAPNQPCTRAQIVTFLWRAAGSPAPKSMSSFADVPADAFYAKAVAWAVENGITGGTGDGKFSPDATCTRAQSVTFLYRAAGSPKVSGSAEFGDVATNAYYADAVAWAAKNGITGGIGGGLFGSGNNCTRAQIVTFLYRSVK